MTLEEAILHAEEVADRCAVTDGNIQCENEHRQLAEWLKDYKRLLEQELCDDAISRDAVEEIINDIRDCISVEGYWAILERMKKLSSVKPQESKTGHWIEVIDEIDSLGSKTWHHKCSICGNENSGWGNYNYCPDCGAKMESEVKRHDTD